MMRKHAVLVGFAVVLLAACASLSKAPDELDTAIRETSNYLNGKIPIGHKIAVVNIQSDSQDLSNYIIDEMIANAVNDKALQVVDRQKLDTIRMELDFNTSSEVSDESAQRIGQMLGAQTIVLGQLGKLGSRYRLTIRALNTETAGVEGQFNRNITRSSIINDLLKVGGASSTTDYGGRTRGGSNSKGGAGDGGGSANNANGAGKSAGKASVPSIANGTYTLWPRPQAMDSGLPVRTVFLAQMVYTSDYTVIFFADKAEGSFKDGIHGTSTYCWQEWKTLQLQDLDNPSKFYTPVNGQASSAGGGAIWSISFKRLPVKRFKLTAESWGNLQIFYEVVVPSVPDTDRDYTVGEPGPAGGLVFYDKGNKTGGWRYLEAAPLETEKEARIYNRSDFFQTAVGSNSDNILRQLNDALGAGKDNTEVILNSIVKVMGLWDTPAQICDELSVNGFDDWYLPSYLEASYMYGNLHRKEAGGFRDALYWTSNAAIPSIHLYFYAVNFKDGTKDTQYLNTPRIFVRAVRRF